MTYILILLGYKVVLPALTLRFFRNFSRLKSFFIPYSSTKGFLLDMLSHRTEKINTMRVRQGQIASPVKAVLVVINGNSL